MSRLVKIFMKKSKWTSRINSNLVGHVENRERYTFHRKCGEDETDVPLKILYSDCSMYHYHHTTLQFSSFCLPSPRNTASVWRTTLYVFSETLERRRAGAMPEETSSHFTMH